jgi:hypothetical protein
LADSRFGGGPAELSIDDRRLEIAEASLPGGGSVVELQDTTQVRDLDAARTMLLASTSHELKTPLTAISGFARWLQAHPQDTEQRDKAVDAIVTCADEHSDLVEKILLSARTESTAGDLVVERTDVVPLLSAISPDGGDVILGASTTENGDVEITVRDHGIGFGRRCPKSSVLGRVSQFQPHEVADAKDPERSSHDNRQRRPCNAATDDLCALDRSPPRSVFDHTTTGQDVLRPVGGRSVGQNHDR